MVELIAVHTAGQTSQVKQLDLSNLSRSPAPVFSHG